MSRVKVLFGPPGTGKTTTLLNTVDTLLEAGTPPDRIAFTSFTRFAADEARTRAIRRFGYSEEELPYFRTLHSMAYRELGLARSEVMDTRDYSTVANSIGLTLTGKYNYETERIPDGGSLGDACLRLYSLSKARHTTLEQEWRLAPERHLLWPTVQAFYDTLQAFKRDRGVLDFTDMLDLCTTALPVDAVIIDEAQDQTLAQWALARRLAAGAEEVHIAGDDDQALYDWAGASSRTLRTLAGERVVLPHSYRLPVNVKVVADRISGRINQRVGKEFSARDEEGSVSWIQEVGEIDFRDDQTWLLLCRHRYQANKYIKECRSQGVVYKLDGVWSNELPYVRAARAYQHLLKGGEVSDNDARLVAEYVADMIPPEGQDSYRWRDMEWPYEGRPDWIDALTRMVPDEREYIRSLRRNGESLSKHGRVEISTIHGAKGGEADRVVLSTDITKRTFDNLHGSSEEFDAEQRVWYVACSRARSTLYLMSPHTHKFWSL